MLKNAMKLLYSEYEKCLSIVKNSEFHIQYAEEKIHHSLQVLGAGNYIIKHEKWFQNHGQEFIDLAKTAVLLHDIARFEEIIGLWNKTPRIDHGVVGGEKLRNMPEYNDIRITLPIKHHGHIKEKFYEDEEYLAIKDNKLRNEVEHIFWLIRDADKVANFNIVCYETEKYMSLFVPNPDQTPSSELKISQKVIEDFKKHKTVDYNLRQTAADHSLTFISWFFDLNYKASVAFCRKLNLIKLMFDGLQNYHNDKVLNNNLKEEVDKFLENNFK